MIVANGIPGDGATSKGLVSIITPAFRAASVVGETIQSVLDQTYADWELLIADDCSPDNTREVVQDWCRKDARIQLIELERNGGPAMARNAGLRRASGRWVAFLDSDDLWLPGKLRRSIDFANERGAAFVFTGFRRITADGRTTGRYIPVPASLGYRDLLGDTAIATSTVLLDRNQVGEIVMRKTYYDDFDCWLGILKRGFTAYGLDEDLMRYRVMQKSVSRNKRRSAMEVWKAFRHLEKLNLLQSSWYFTSYAIRGWWKYRQF